MAALKQIHDLDLKQMRVFLAVVESGGLSAAQNTLGLTAPAISKYLSDLEVRLGVKLCNRGRSGFEMTASGRCYYEKAKQLSLKLLQFQKEIDSELTQSQQREVRLGTVDYVVSDNQNPLLSALKKQFKLLQSFTLSPRTLTCNEIIDGLLQDHLDIGLSFQPSTLAELHCQLLYHEEIILVVNPEHPLVSDKALSSSTLEISASKIIDVKNQYLIASFNRHIKSLDIPVKLCDSLDEILWLVQIDDYIGVLPKHVVYSALEEQKLVALQVSQWQLRSPIYLLYRRAKRRHEIVAAILKDLE